MSGQGENHLPHGETAVWVEFQVAARKFKKTEGYERIASEFGRAVDTVKEWPSEVSKRLGRSVVREALDISCRVGELGAATQVMEGQPGDADLLAGLAT